MRKPKIGLLCMYVKLYDDTAAWLRPDVEKFKSIIEERLEGLGVEVARHEICRLEAELLRQWKTLKPRKWTLW